ncbi:MAG: hypothetical protein NTZ34_14285 [Chloroflexi bacterium]|nr:hypothetical protein [Chloroflexota bacterium]
MQEKIVGLIRQTIPDDSQHIWGFAGLSGLMKRLFGHIHTKLTIIIVCVFLISSSCSAQGHEGFAVYLTKGDIPPAQMPALSHIDITEQPVIGMDDITEYNANTHQITLTANAFDRISSLEVPVRGKSFVVCVDRKPIYWGAFWTPISSISFDGVTIWKPFKSQEPKIIKLDLGYPSSSFYGGEDPRNNAEVMESLEQAGKLTDLPSATTVDKLPHSMKGYELYSWSEDNQWHFTLITGTNRDKTLEEIIPKANIVSPIGWVQIHVAGVDAIKTVLGRLPQKEEIFWLAGLRLEQTPPGNVNIMLPAASIINTIKEYAGRCGLKLQVQM